MKKRFLALYLACLLLVTLFAGCAAHKSAGQAEENAAASMAVYNSAVYDYAAIAPEAPAPESEAPAKVIHTAEMDLETTDFDEAVEALAQLTGELGGYYEASRLDTDGGRRASYTVRVPAENFRAFLDRAGGICHVLSVSEDADDVGEVYYDTEGRLKTQQAKLARLRELLGQAEDMEDMIALEGAISQTEEEIDRLSGTLSRFDSQVDLASIWVVLRAVSRLSNVPEPEQSLGQRLAAAFREGLASFGAWVQGLLEALAYSWTWLLLALVVLLAAVLLLRRARRKRKAKKPRRVCRRSGK